VQDASAMMTEMQEVYEDIAVLRIISYRFFRGCLLFIGFLIHMQ